MVTLIIKVAVVMINMTTKIRITTKITEKSNNSKSRNNSNNAAIQVIIRSQTIRK